MNVGVVGLGLIGGSMARAYKKAGHTVYATDKDENILMFSQVSEVVTAPLDENTLPQCDLILICIMPEGTIKYLEKNSKYINKSAFVIDSCGTKVNVCKKGFELSNKYGYTFVGGHPMAGTHFSGFKYSRASMFSNAAMILVPEKNETIDVLQRVKNLLVGIGFKSVTISNAEEHDRIIAYTSQLAHVVSNAYVKSPNARVHKGFSAGSYRDLTRVAKLNPRMWAELFMENSDNITFEIDNIIAELQKYSDAIKAGDTEALEQLLAEGTKIKESIG